MAIPFAPQINRQIFKENILQLQQQEGNNPLLTGIVSTALAQASHLSFFDRFLAICQQYHIGYSAFVNNDCCEVNIIVNGRISHQLAYSNAEKDITSQLADILYSQLTTQIMNEIFLKRAGKDI